MIVPTAESWVSSNAIPQTQNTAPVLEFRCLYTSDLRRKQKRWQDGRLKYHTFNKRIMVYDDRSNFVGDSHWREDHAFGEGEEVELERCGILVEVSECVGTREQDLTPLLSKVVKARQGGAHVRAVASSPFRPPDASIRTQIAGLPRADLTDLRSAKRRKPNNSPSSKNGYAQTLTGATLALSGTASTTAPLRYDPLWSQTMTRPVEEIDMSNSARTNRIHQERPVAISISHTKTSGSQAKRLSKKPSPASVKSGYAQNITGAALILASKTLTGRALPSAYGTAEKATARSGDSHPAAITIEEDEFVDIDVYDRGNIQVEESMRSSSKVTNPAKNRQEQPLPNLLSHQSHSEGDQPERPLNPLRIRTRPKRKLLSVASPPSHLNAFTEPSGENDNEAICPPTAPKNAREPQRLMAPVPQAEPVIETGPLDVKGHRLSPLRNAVLDHHNIDALLMRKVLEQTSISKEQHADVQARTNNINFTQPAEQSKEATGFEGQEEGSSSQILGPQLEVKQKPTHSPRQQLLLRANTDTDVKDACTGPSGNFRLPSRLMKSFSEGIEASKLRGLTIIATAEDVEILKPTYQAGRDLTMKWDNIPFKPPAKLTCPTTQSTKLARKDNKQGAYDESVMPHMIASARPAVPIRKAKMAHEDAVNRDLGPWSREAFDLFDWRPGAATMGDGLAAG